MKLSYPQQRLRGVVAGLLALVILSGCAAQYVSRYDAATEAGINTIQRDVEELLQNIERGIANPGTVEADYSSYAPAYEALKLEATLLHTRAQAIDLNSITSQQFAELRGWIDNLQTLHESGIGSPAILLVPRRQAEQIFVAMLKFELAKKRQFDTPIIDAE